MRKGHLCSLPRFSTVLVLGAALSAACHDSDDSRSTPPFTVAQVAYAKSSNTQASDDFGSRHALSGETLVVAAHGEDGNAMGIDGDQINNGAPDSGAVYVFTRVAGAWSQQAYVKASNTATGDDFGSGLALSGDTLAVGAQFEDSDATGVGGDELNDDAVNSGAVYVFTRAAGVWTQQAYIKASNPGGEDHFGRAVALSGDTLVVGADGESSDATGIGGDQLNDDAVFAGAVYVFTRTAGVWSQQAYLKASNTGASDRFGSVLSLSGETLAVGAFGEDSDATGVGGDQLNDDALTSGAVYVFRRNAGVWSQQAYVKASNAAADDRFGLSLSLSNDTLAVGALFEDSDASGIDGDELNDDLADSGAVYVFTRNSGVWSQTDYVKASNTGAGDHFGASVALEGNVLAVSASLESSDAAGIGGDQLNDNAPFSGAVYVFTRSGATWTQHSYVKASNCAPNDLFGSGLSIGGGLLAVSASGEDSSATGVGGDEDDNGATASGAVYVFD